MSWEPGSTTCTLPVSQKIAFHQGHFPLPLFQSPSKLPRFSASFLKSVSKVNQALLKEPCSPVLSLLVVLLPDMQRLLALIVLPTLRRVSSLLSLWAVPFNPGFPLEGRALLLPQNIPRISCLAPGKTSYSSETLLPAHMLCVFDLYHPNRKTILLPKNNLHIHITRITYKSEGEELFYGTIIFCLYMSNHKHGCYIYI